MLIASVSDLHTDFPENRDEVVRLAGEIHRRGAEVVVIAGDVSHRDERVERTLRAFREVASTVVYVPGNHDLWQGAEKSEKEGRGSQSDTWTRYSHDLRALAEAAGAHYLPASPVRLGSIALAGTCGWYDYSFVPQTIRASLDADAFARKRYREWMWSDARFIAFRDAEGGLMSDPDVARRMEDELALQLKELESDPAIEHVVVATHHQAFGASVHRTGSLPWEYFNAFMGSERLGEVILRSRKVRAAVYGHTHFVGEFRVGDVRVFGTPLGYPRERFGVGKEEILKTRIGWITVGCEQPPHVDRRGMGASV